MKDILSTCIKTNLPVYNKNRRNGFHVGQKTVWNMLKQHCIKALRSVQWHIWKKFPIPTKSNQPVCSKNMQATCRVRKTLILNGIKTEAVIIKYLKYDIYYHGFFIWLTRSLPLYLLQSSVLFSPICMVTSFFSRLYALRISLFYII